MTILSFSQWNAQMPILSKYFRQYIVNIFYRPRFIDDKRYYLVK